MNESPLAYLMPILIILKFNKFFTTLPPFIFYVSFHNFTFFYFSVFFRQNRKESSRLYEVLGRRFSKASSFNSNNIINSFANFILSHKIDYIFDDTEAWTFTSLSLTPLIKSQKRNSTSPINVNIAISIL